MKQSVLLIDDEEDIRLVLGISLADLGYEVIPAENGETGLRLFFERRPPIVITDIKMPDIDGLTLLRRIKGEAPETEVVMITGHGDMETAIESLKFEATDFITKPIHIEALEAAMHRVQENILTREKLREYTANLEGLVWEKSVKLSELEQMFKTEYDQDEFGAFQNRFQQIFNETPCYLTVHDRDFRLTAVNRHFRDDFGDRIGDYCYEAYKHREEPCEDCPVRRTFESGEPQQAATQFVSQDAQPIEALVQTAPMRGLEGEVTHVVVMATQAAQMVETRDHLSSLGLLIASVSHSIKGLLTGLDGGVYMLESGLKKGRAEQLQEGMSVIRLMTDRIRSLVLDILLFAKERELNIRRLEVSDLAREAARAVETKARELSVDLVLDLSPHLIYLRADHEFLRTALINVLENALEACVEDGSKPDRRVCFEVGQDEEWVVFRIQDNGVGMSEQTQEKIFNLFFSSKGKKGTGLGLYITRKIIRQHGGEIGVESAPGRGTTMTVKLPRDLLAEDDETAPRT
ncbi:MAG: response regulator [Thermodesulfobacteriota bacterium]